MDSCPGSQSFDGWPAVWASGVHSPVEPMPAAARGWSIDGAAVPPAFHGPGSDRSLSMPETTSHAFPAAWEDNNSTTCRPVAPVQDRRGAATEASAPEAPRGPAHRGAVSGFCIPVFRGRSNRRQPRGRAGGHRSARETCIASARRSYPATRPSQQFSHHRAAQPSNGPTSITFRRPAQSVPRQTSWLSAVCRNRKSDLARPASSGVKGVYVRAGSPSRLRTAASSRTSRSFRRRLSRSTTAARQGTFQFRRTGPPRSGVFPPRALLRNSRPDLFDDSPRRSPPQVVELGRWKTVGQVPVLDQRKMLGPQETIFLGLSLGDRQVPCGRDVTSACSRSRRSRP